MKLCELAKVIRSKNAGPFELTFDILFDSVEIYRRVKQSKALSASTFAALYGITIADVLCVVEFEPALAIKITIKRAIPSGSLGDTDVYRAQQHAPLLGLEILD
jgi:hypothetical protein